MCVLLIKYYVVLLYIFIIYITTTNCITTKYSKYKKFPMEHPILCSPITPRKIEMKKDREEAVLVTQTVTKEHTIDWAANWNCQFEVHSDTGLFAVIQTMNFRRNTTTDECIDYVKFETRQSNFNKKLCGTINVANEYNVYGNTIDSYGYIQTTIHISKNRWNLPEQMDLKIVYTKYRRCNTMYSPCMKDNNKECIHNDLFNDSLVNCPIDDCYDENNCESLRKRLNLEQCGEEFCNSIQSSANSSKVILSAVTSLVISFVLFIICIWVCKKTGKVCWGANCSDSTRTRQPSRVIEMQNRTTESVGPPVQPEVPNAPDPEKDLPPSYDSLFPAR